MTNLLKSCEISRNNKMCKFLYIKFCTVATREDKNLCALVF